MSSRSSRKGNNHHQQGEEDTLFSRILQGRLVSGAFFTRHWIKVLVVLAMVLVYITNRYSCQRSMERIHTLTNRLAVVQTESYRIRGEYMSRIRESAMRRSLEEAGLDLAVQARPPYHISSSEAEE